MGTVVALAPLWFAGVEGSEVTGLDVEGVLGVKRLAAGSGRLCREDGV